MNLSDIWRATARAETAGGASRWRQLAEMAVLRLSYGKLQPDEYFSYRLFRRDLALAEKRAFLGYWMWDALYAPNSPRDSAVANSKLASYALFAREGLPHPRVRAVIGAAHDHPDSVHLDTADEIATYFRAAAYPLFIKPDSGAHGIGGMLVDGLDDDRLRLRDGSYREVDSLRGGTVALLVQDAIEPHPALRRMTGGTPPTARVYVLNHGGETSIHSAVLRIPVGRAMVDNFHAGRTGNLIAEIDIAEGTCAAAVAGLGFDYRIADRHPDTGEPIRGVPVPGWLDASAVVRRAARLFPGLPIQAWDVAFTPAGPSIIEINAKGEFRILQHARQRGLIDERFQQVARLRTSPIARRSRPAPETAVA
jgi:hypothetical protein